MAEEHAERHLIADGGIRIVGQNLSDLRVESELSGIHQTADRDRGEHLPHRSEIELRIEPVLHPEAPVSQSERAFRQNDVAFGQRIGPTETPGTGEPLDVRLNPGRQGLPGRHRDLLEKERPRRRRDAGFEGALGVLSDGENPVVVDQLGPNQNFGPALAIGQVAHSGESAGPPEQGEALFRDLVRLRRPRRSPMEDATGLERTCIQGGEPLFDQGRWRGLNGSGQSRDRGKEGHGSTPGSEWANRDSVGCRRSGFVAVDRWRGDHRTIRSTPEGRIEARALLPR